MKQEDKDLLLKDLCARLPYDVKVELPSGIRRLTAIDICTEYVNHEYPFLNYKPYLRPMSSMTEEEKDYLYNNFGWTIGDFTSPRIEALDYMFSHHLDFRGLIKKGLAIEVTEENNPYKS